MAYASMAGKAAHVLRTAISGGKWHQGRVGRGYCALRNARPLLDEIERAGSKG